MRATDVDGDSFTILSDEGQMIGSVTVSDRQHVEVNMTSTSSDGEDPWREHMPRIREWAEAEARRLGLIDG